MGRPTNKIPTIKVPVSATPKLIQYLDDLIAEEGYGTSHAGVARNLIWDAIGELIHKGILDRHKGKFLPKKPAK